MSLNTCRICDSSNIYLAFIKNNKISQYMEAENLWKIYECKDCQCRFIKNNETKFDYQSYYNEEYSISKLLKTEGERQRSYKKYSIIQNAIIDKILDKKDNTKYKALDIGCNTGIFLDNLSDRFDKYGIDLSIAACNIATSKNIKAFNKNLENIKFESSYFDIISMYAVIEHLRDPISALNEVKRILKKNGILIIMTGDWKSIKARIYKDKWKLYSPPEHQFFFTKYTIDKIMSNLGFKCLKYYYSSGGISTINNYYLNYLWKLIIYMLYDYLSKYSLSKWFNQIPLFDHYYSYYIKTTE